MDYIAAVTVTGLIVGFIVGFITWAWTRTSVEGEWSNKWTLGICHSDTGWQPLLERHLDNHHWEYIYINKENLPLITHIAHSSVPSVPGPFVSTKEDRVYKMLQDMVNRGHGNITGIEKEENY